MYSPPEMSTLSSGNYGDSTFVRILFALARSLFLTSIVVAPWCFGGVWADTQFVLYAAVLVSLVIWGLAATWQAVIAQLDTNRLPLILLPMIGGLILGAYQLSKVPDPSLAETIQNTIDSSVASVSDEDDKRRIASASLIESVKSDHSIDAFATRRQLVRLLFVVITMFLASQLFARQKAQRWLWGSLALNGSALACFGIAQQLSWNGKMFWTFPMRHGGFPFASFVNRNNAAGYLCLCLSGALGLAIWKFSRRLAPHERSGFSSESSTRTSSHREDSREVKFCSISDWTVSHLMIAVMLVLIATGIGLATSRGGWLALAVATAVVCLLITRSNRLVAITFVFGIGIFSIAFIAWTGLANRISRRLAQSCTADAITGDGRWAHWNDAINVLRDFPSTGTGFGTYRFAYLPYQTHEMNVRFYNADNQFLEWFVEGGVTGLGLVLIFIFLMAIAIWALLRRLQICRNDPVGFVGLFALVSQCVSGFFDFGPTIPANAMALAAIFGAVAGRSSQLVAKGPHGFYRFGVSLPGLRPLLLVPVFGAVLLLLGVSGLREIEKVAANEVVVREIPLRLSPESLDSESTDRLIKRLTEALKTSPDDSESLQALAELWIHRLRMRVFQDAVALNPSREKSEIWTNTDPVFIYEQVHKWRRMGQIERIETLIELPWIQENVVPARKLLLDAQAVCPLIPDVDRLLGKLAFMDSTNDYVSEGHLRRALILAPVDSNVLYEVGYLAHCAELTDFAFACWRRSLTVGTQHLAEVYRTLSDDMSIDEQIDRVIPASVETLIQLGQILRTNGNTVDRYVVANRAVGLLSISAKENLPEGELESERLRNLGRIKLLLDAPSEAVVEYRRALEIASNRIAWRLELIDILIKQEALKAALKEAEICQVLEPDHKQHQVMVRDLRARILAEHAVPNPSSSKH